MKNLGKKVLVSLTAVLVSIAIGMMIGWDMKESQLKQYPILIIPERPAEFYPGDTLTSNESGDWILWDSTMIRDLQVAYVTDSGTIEVLK